MGTKATMFVDPSMAPSSPDDFKRERKPTPLRGFLHYDIVTINVEITTSRSPLSEAAFARHSTGF